MDFLLSYRDLLFFFPRGSVQGLNLLRLHMLPHGHIIHQFNIVAFHSYAGGPDWSVSQIRLPSIKLSILGGTAARTLVTC